MFQKTILRIILIGLIVFAVPFFAQATTGDFNVDPSYDFLNRSNVTAFLYQIGENAYFYIEDGYYQSLNDEEKKEFAANVRNLSREFDDVIYPGLTELFGFEWKPGIDKDEKITVLLTRIKEESGGYFNPGDEFSRAQVPASNEREMLYLNVNYLEDSLIKSYLAHEFLHLVTFNQKNRLRGKSEEVWLNELRADLASTLLGYDGIYQGSNLQRRVKTFVQKPQDPLTEWKNENFDYGVANLFGQYLIERAGEKILIDSLKSDKVGIPSLQEALKKNGFQEDFSRIFSEWLITVVINDCSLGSKYCYLNQNLKNLKIIPQLNYLPLAGESTLTVTDYIKEWAGSWFKFIGGQGTLKLEFIGEATVNFEVPYITRDSSGKHSINFLNLGASERGTLYLPNFGKNYDSLIIIPSVQNKISGFDGIEPSYKYIWSASIINENSEEQNQEELIKKLLAQIESLKNEIAKVQAQISDILAKKGGAISCSKFENTLYYGMADNSEVRCLQEFLKNQGPEIYPEGLITGNFLSLTRTAVIRFQEKYAKDILVPSGLEKGTGFVGPATRAKLNSLLGR